jgi:hypothetical protein
MANKKPEDPAGTTYLRALHDIVEAIEPLDVRNAGAALTYALAGVIILGRQSDGSAPDMREKLDRLATAYQALGAAVRRMIREQGEASDDVPPYPDLLRKLLARRRKGKKP